MVYWVFYRESGNVFDEIMAPFVWKFPELNVTISGDDLKSVTKFFDEPGAYTAVLNVDGNEIACAPLTVLGN